MNDLKIRKFSKTLYDALETYAGPLPLAWEDWKRIVEPIIRQYTEGKDENDAAGALYIVAPWNGGPEAAVTIEGVACYDRATALAYLRLKRDNYIMDNPENKNITLDTEELVLHLGSLQGWAAHIVNVVSGA